MLSASDEQLMCYDVGGELRFREFQDYVDAGRLTRDEMQQGALDFINDAVRFRETIAPEMAVSAARAQELFEEFVVEKSDTETKIFSSLLLDDFYCGRGVVVE
jgi:hypothetical protein